MSFKSKVAAAAATLTLVGGVGMAGALTAGSASRGHAVVRHRLRQRLQLPVRHAHSPNYVVDVLRQGDKAGQPIILFRTANYDPAEDWTVAFQGTVADFFAADLVSAETALHYGCIARHPADFDLQRDTASRDSNSWRSRTSTRRSA